MSAAARMIPVTEPTFWLYTEFIWQPEAVSGSLSCSGAKTDQQLWRVWEAFMGRLHEAHMWEPSLMWGRHTHLSIFLPQPAQASEPVICTADQH